MSDVTVRSYNVVLEPDPDGGYVAVVPAFPGCYSQGDSVEEALANAREAITLTIEDMAANNEALPDPFGDYPKSSRAEGRLVATSHSRRWYHG